MNKKLGKYNLNNKYEEWKQNKTMIKGRKKTTTYTTTFSFTSFNIVLLVSLILEWIDIT
jgi:hypothetical protein